ncbi:hypothetical protein [Mesorhizobium sp. M0571]|uniref:hypothetical protein n=1 Tax=unclassified Mesorhizobium TaxID=325217 RepID=UPI00333D2954
MITKILAASVFALGIASSAMAQSSDTYSSQTRHRPVYENEQPVDRNTTGSIYGGNSGPGTQVIPSPLGPCASHTPGPDANANTNVNDQYCGK